MEGGEAGWGGELFAVSEDMFVEAVEPRVAGVEVFEIGGHGVGLS